MSKTITETPPHTWRKFRMFCLAKLRRGNTSTYVEKMTVGKCRLTPLWKHLHIRGENLWCTGRLYGLGETPPHTWRKFSSRRWHCNRGGNTSTYVEKINRQFRVQRSSQKHLHIRGENDSGVYPLRSRGETPLHTWRKLNHDHNAVKFRGNTSTYVEKIKKPSISFTSPKKHLHIRGENSTS